MFASVPVLLDPRIERAWREAVETVSLPENDDEVMTLVEAAIRACAPELDIQLSVRRDGTHIRIWNKALGSRFVSLCNGRLQGGQLGRQLEALRLAMRPGAIWVALRTAAWRLPPESSTGRLATSFWEAGGRTASIDAQELREMAAARTLIAADVPGLAAWRMREQPHARLGFLCEVLDLPRRPMDPAPALPPRAASRAMSPRGRRRRVTTG